MCVKGLIVKIGCVVRGLCFTPDRCFSLYFADIRTTTVCPIGFFFKLSHVKTLQEYFWIEKLGKLANSLVNQEALKEKTKGGENKKRSL